MWLRCAPDSRYLALITGTRYRRAAENAGLLIRQSPERRDDGEDEGDHRPIHRIEGVSEPAHPEQPPMEAGERQPLDALERAQVGFGDRHRLLPPGEIH